MKNSKGRQLQQVSFTVLAQWMHLIGWTYKNKPQQSNTRIVQKKNLKNVLADSLIRDDAKHEERTLNPCSKSPKRKQRCDDGGVDAAALNSSINNSNNNYVTLEMVGDMMEILENKQKGLLM